MTITWNDLDDVLRQHLRSLTEGQPDAEELYDRIHVRHGVVSRDHLLEFLQDLLTLADGEFERRESEAAMVERCDLEDEIKGLQATLNENRDREAELDRLRAQAEVDSSIIARLQAEVDALTEADDDNEAVIARLHAEVDALTGDDDERHAIQTEHLPTSWDRIIQDGDA